MPAGLLSAQHRASRQKTQLLLFPWKVTDCTPKVIAIPALAHRSGFLLACTWGLTEKTTVRGWTGMWPCPIIAPSSSWLQRENPAFSKPTCPWEQIDSIQRPREWQKEFWGAYNMCAVKAGGDICHTASSWLSEGCVCDSSCWLFWMREWSGLYIPLYSSCFSMEKLWSSLPRGTNEGHQKLKCWFEWTEQVWVVPRISV